MEKIDLSGLPELTQHVELKVNMESAWKLLQIEQYRSAANELRQALEYIIDCYILAANQEEKGISESASLYNKIELLKKGDWISSAQAESYHSIRMRCNAGVHRNSDSQGRQMTPADIRYCYELLVQELQEFLCIFPESQQKEEDKETKKDILSQNWEKYLEKSGKLKKEKKKAVQIETAEPEAQMEEKEQAEPEVQMKVKDIIPEKKRDPVKELEYFYLKDRTGENTERVFSEMMEDLLKKI